MARQLEELSDAELRGVAERLGIEVPSRPSRAELIECVRARERIIDDVSREELARIVRWAGEEVKDFHTKDVLIRRFYRLNFRKTGGLTADEVRIVARLHELDFDETTSDGELAERVEKSARRWTDVLKRASGRVVGYIARKVAGDRGNEDRMEDPEETQAAVSSNLRKGFKAALRFSMDDYIADKLDEIEGRIDRKLEELDRKMDEWRTREVRHRLRIIKYTLIGTVIVAGISIVYKIVTG